MMLKQTPGAGFILAVSITLLGCAANSPQPKAVTKNTAPVYAPEQALNWSRKGQKAFQQGDTAGAIDAWQRSAALDPTDARVCNNLAILLKQQGRFSEAADVLETGLTHNADTAELHYNLGVISELYLLDLERALIHYQKYRDLTGKEDKLVAGWIADLERRLH